MTPKVTIAILNWNGKKYLEKIIPAIKNINYKNKEILVVDNNSNDGSKEFLKNYNGLKIIQNPENYGYSQGKNIGVKNASGEYIYFLDNDILIQDTEMLHKLLKIYQTVESPAFLCPCLIEEDRDHTIYYTGRIGFSGIKLIKPIPCNLLKKLTKKYYQTQLVFGGNLFFKKELWQKIGGLDESLPFHLDDNDISVTANLWGYKCYMVVNKPINIHLGVYNRQNDKYYRWQYQYMLAGHLISYLKNFQIHNFILISIGESIKIFFKTIKQVIWRNDFLLIFAFIKSFYIFIKYLPKTLEKRKFIQKSRRISDRQYFQAKYQDDIVNQMI